MKLSISLILFLFIGSYCVDKNNQFIIKLKDCNGVTVPMDILLKTVKVGSLYEIQPINNKECIGRLKMKDSFVVKANMIFYFKKVFVGDPYIDILIDSSKASLDMTLSIKDTIIGN